MKKILFLIALILCVYSVNSQGVTYFSENPSAMLYSLPRTSLKVRIVVEKHTVTKGIYARYAQKYLGITVPLSNKEFYTLKGASINAFTESDPSEIYAIDASKSVLTSLMKQSGNLTSPISEPLSVDIFSSQTTDNEFTFTDIGISPLTGDAQEIMANSVLPADKKSVDFKSLEDRAKELADVIFTLRTRRYELITGESSENVFGEGLAAAIAEMARLEKNYIELFAGKSSVTQIVREYELVPTKDKKTYFITRFSAKNGLVPLTDLSADPIVLELNPEKVDPKISLPRIDAPANPKEVLVQDLFKYKVAVATDCRLHAGDNDLIIKRLPIYQFGYTVDIPVNIEIRK